MTKNLTYGNTTKVLLFFALPMMLGNLFQQIYNLADSIIVGNYVGSDALAAVGGTFPVTFLAIAIATGASTGCAIVISQAYGAGNKEKVNSSMTTAISIIALLGIIIMILSLLFIDPLLKALGTPSDIFDATSSYLRIVFYGCFFMYMYNCLTAIFNALGDSKTPLFFLIFSTVLNIGLDLLFVAKLNMGTNGAAYATFIAQTLAALGLIIYFFIKFRHIFNTSKKHFVDTKIAKEMILYAVPSTIQQTVVSIGMIAVQGVVNSFGTDFIAGYSASTKIDSIAILPILNLSVALSTFTAQNLGARNMERVKEGFKSATVVSCLISVVCSVILIVFGKFFMSLFIEKGSHTIILDYGEDYFKIISLFYVALAVMFCANGFHRGIGNLKIFTVSTAINMALRISLAYFLKDWLGYKAIFWGVSIGWIVGGLISFVFYAKGKWQNKFAS